jgi:hypothetical protein
MKRHFVFTVLILMTFVVSGWDFDDDYSTPSAYDYGTEEESSTEENYLDPKPAPAPAQPAEKKSDKPSPVDSKHKFHFALGTNIIGIYHEKITVTTETPDPLNPGSTVKTSASSSDTSTTIGFPLTQWDFSAGYKLIPNLWLMAKFKLYMELENDATGHFLIGPGLRGDIISNELLNFFAGGFVSIGNEGKAFVFSPEAYSGVEFKLIEYIALGGKISFAYELNARKNLSIHNIIFGVGAHLAVYF